MAELSAQDDLLSPSSPLTTSFVLPEAVSGKTAAPQAEAKPAAAPEAAKPAEKPQAAPDAALSPIRPQAQPRAAGPQAQHAPVNDATSLIAHFEGFRAAPYWDVNHWRVGYGSDTITHADGSIEKVTPFTRVTQEDALRDLHRRTAMSQNDALVHVGAEAWSKLTPGAQAALTSLSYNYGSLSKIPSVIAAARAGDPQTLAQAIQAQGGANGGVNARRRAQEAGAVLGTFGLSGPIAAGAGAGKSYAMPPGAEDAPLPPGAGGATEPEAKPVEAKKFDLSDLSFDKPGEKKAFDLSDLSFDEGAKKVGEEAGAEGKGFIGRAYDKLVGGIKSLAPDPDEEAANINRQNETGAALVRGFGNMLPGNDRAVAGLKTVLPEAIGGTGKPYAENLETQRQSGAALRAEHPIATIVGEVGGGLVGGAGLEKAGAEIASRVGAPMLTDAEVLSPWGAMKSGAKGAGTYGAAQGALDSPDWTKPEDVAKDAAIGGAGGALLGGAAAGVFRGLGSAFDSAAENKATRLSREPEEEAMHAIGQGVAKHEAIAGEAKAAAEEVEAKRAAAETEAKKQEAAAAKAKKAQDVLDQQALVRAERTAAKVEDAENPASAVEIRKQALEKMHQEMQSRAIQAKKAETDAIAAAEKAKIEAAKAEEDAKKLAVEQSSADKLSKRGTAEHLRENITSVVEDLVKERNEKSGLPKILNDAGRENGPPIVRTNDLSAYVESISPKLRSDEAKSTLSWIEGKLKTEIEGGSVKGVSLHNVDEIRRAIGDARRAIRDPMQNKHVAGARDDLKVLDELEKRLKAAADKAYPGYSESIQNYRDLSRPLDPYVYKGPLAVNKLDPLSGDYKMSVGRVADSILNKIKSGEEGLADLIKARPQLKDVIDAHLTQKLFGEDKLEGKVSSETIRKFIAANENILEQAGLKQKYMDLLETRRAAETKVKETQAAAQAALDAAGQARKTAQEVAAKRDKIGAMTPEKPLTRQDEKPAKTPEPTKAAKTPEPTKAELTVADKRRDVYAKDVAERKSEATSKAAQAKKAAEQLSKEKAQHEKLVDAARVFKEQTENMTSENIKDFRGAAKASKDFFDTLHEQGKITQAEHLEALEQAKRIDHLFKTREEAEKAYRRFMSFTKATTVATLAYQALKNIHFPVMLRNMPP